eukprot:TRINITY_DN7627_c0_g1_i2.p1 TRINITY_DN7627_c0_g1~~TRINITY_DN7627_c0_g1_i2.p1  ORF type:complete len:143 (+),score=2.74 TRINITY_DN7627_c0_g1_i2:1286-1714(+)
MPRCVASFEGLGEEQSAADVVVPEVSLNTGKVGGRNTLKNLRQFANVSLSNSKRDAMPRNDVCKRKRNIVCNDHRDAPQRYRFHYARAPRCPPQRTQAENGPENLRLISLESLPFEIKSAVSTKLLPYHGSHASAQARSQNR